MSGNSNLSINSPASTNHELDTLVGDDAIVAVNLLQEFNDRQIPAGFERNGGQVDIQVSSHGGENILARWIRLMGNGEVVARAGERANKPEYVVSLYLPSDYSTRPTALLPPWFLELLQASGGAYHTLAEAARGLDHPAAYAKVERYHHHHTHRAELEVACRAIVADIDKEDDTLQGIEHCMEAYRLHA